MLRDRLKLVFDADPTLTQARLAEACGVKPPSVSNWFSGQSQAIKGKNLLRAAKYLNVRPDWLESGIGPMRPDPRDHEWADIPAHAQSFGLGEGQEADEYAVTRKLKFRRDSLERQHLQPSALQVAYGTGDSMLPLIRDGAAILFDTSDTTPRDGRVYMIHLPGQRGPEYSAKKCTELLGHIAFEALNPDGDHHWKKPRAMLDPKRPIPVIGRVRWVAAWVD